MVDDYMIDKVLDKIKEIIGIEKIDDTKILIITDDQLSHNIILNRLAINFIHINFWIMHYMMNKQNAKRLKKI